MFIKKQRMIELQNINLRLRAGGNVKKRNWYLILGMLLLVQLIAIFYFGSKKAGFHYDEYYSYYSSNVSIGLVPTDREWKPGSEIVDEFRVLSGQRFPVGVRTRLFSFQVRLAVAALPCCGQPDREPLLFGCHFPIRLPLLLLNGHRLSVLCFGAVQPPFSLSPAPFPLDWELRYFPKKKLGRAVLQYARCCCTPKSDTKGQ